MKTCSNCQYYIPDKDGFDFGHCNRYPPQVLSNITDRFPFTNPKVVCGEWKAQEVVKYDPFGPQKVEEV